METVLWDCDFCPASCQDVLKEAKNHRAEFLGSLFAFVLSQGSELCQHRVQEEKSNTDFSVWAGQIGLCGCGDRIVQNTLVCSWIPPL